MEDVTKRTLEEIVEFGYVHIDSSKIINAIQPVYNVYTNVERFRKQWRWDVTLRYLEQYSAHHPEFEGQFYLCLYDGFREYSFGVKYEDREYVEWASLSVDEKKKYMGHGSVGEPRFVQVDHIYPFFDLPVLCYCRHKCDLASMLIPDYEFLTDQFKPFTDQVREHDIPFHHKDKSTVYWRGSRNVWCANHPRIRAVHSVDPFLDASFTRTNIQTQLKHGFLLDLDGQVNAFSALYWKLRSNSVVIKLESIWEQWYYSQLRPDVHYISIPCLGGLNFINFNANFDTMIIRKKEFAQNLDHEYAVTKYTIH